MAGPVLCPLSPRAPQLPILRLFRLTRMIKMVGAYNRIMNMRERFSRSLRVLQKCLLHGLTLVLLWRCTAHLELRQHIVVKLLEQHAALRARVHLEDSPLAVSKFVPALVVVV